MMAIAEVASNITKVEVLLNKRQYEDAMELLQDCINTSRLESKDFMECLRDSTKNPEVLDKLTHIYFLNFV